jgi:hypothetical protein
VLSTAYVLKEQMLESIEMRHANERAYQEAVSEWQRAAMNPEAHPRWMQFYANAIRDALRKTNSRRREAVESLTHGDWRTLVYRELQADHWYDTPEAPVAPVWVETQIEGSVEASARPFVVSVNGNGSPPETVE